MTTLARRTLVSSLAAMPAAAAVPVIGSAQAQGQLAAVPPIARFDIGRFEVAILTDGYTDMRFGYFTGREPGQIEAAAAEVLAARPEGIRIAFNQYLIKDGDRLILVDTGPAGTIGETGQMPRALEALGVAPEDVDAVVITHTHVDHMSGLLVCCRKSFRNAEIYVDRRDIDHFTDPAKRAAAPDFLQSSFDATAELVRLYPAMQRVDGEHEITQGISLIDLTGHTPGHIGVRIEDGGESLLIVSDMLFHPSIHPRAADIGFIFEQDPAAALAMRENFFPRAAEERALIAATHMPFPGLGHIVNDRGELRWLPAEWAHRG